jgi:hypothetical protein
MNSIVEQKTRWRINIMKKGIIVLIGIALLLMATVPVMARTMINQGDTVYIGETHLNIARAQIQYPYNEHGTIGWWKAGQDPATTRPTVIARTFPLYDFSVREQYGNFLGNWYVVKGNGTGNTTIGPFFIVNKLKL